MIFFYVRKEAGKDPREKGWVTIPIVDSSSTRETDANKIMLVSWNEVQCTIDSTVVQIGNLEQLKSAVIQAAKKDSVCTEINNAALKQYGIYLFLPEGKPSEADKIIESAAMNRIIDRIFLEWAHPMIGNIVTSPVVRPQTKNSQYLKNYDGFNILDETTKGKIAELLGTAQSSEAEKALPPLEKSGHDQMRICPDLVTLARAIIGEITTEATRRIEKLFALKLCESQLLYKAQKEIIVKFLEAINENLKNGFWENFNISKMEYITYFFGDCTKTTEAYTADAQKAFYMALVEEAVKDGEKKSLAISHVEDHEKYIALPCVKEWIAQWDKFPKVIQCAIIQNSLRKFWLNVSSDDKKKKLDVKKWGDLRFSIKKNEEGEGYCTCDAAGKKFIPRLKEGPMSVSWSWNRDEQHPATQLYRSELLPLWGGPSGHSHGLVNLVIGSLNATTIEMEQKEVRIAAVALAGMFALWRLYYDKRISPVHTIAETFEASIAAAKINWKEKTEGGAELEFDNTRLTVKSDLKAIEVSDKSDAFYIIQSCVKEDGGIVNPIRLMNTLKSIYYGTSEFSSTETAGKKFDHLKTLLNGTREELSKHYIIPLWSKPIIKDVSLTDEKLDSDIKKAIDESSVLKEIKVVCEKNVRIFLVTLPKPVTEDAVFYNWNITEEETFKLLYEQIIQHPECLLLSEYYKKLPETVNGKKVLGDMKFYNLSNPKLENAALEFMAEIDTGVPVWKEIAEIAILPQKMNIRCRLISDGKYAAFCGTIDWNEVLHITDKLTVELKSVTLESCMDAGQFIQPSFSVAAAIGELAVQMTWKIDSHSILVQGEFTDGKVLSLKGILELFGLDDGLSVLPEGLSEGMFGNLGLCRISMQLTSNPVKAERIELVISAEKPWSILSGKITLKPYLCVSVEDPFCRERRKVELQIQGIWLLGGTAFETLIIPLTGKVSARMQEGESLNVAAAMQSFAEGMVLPDISIREMSLNANYKEGSYEILLDAEHCLDFQICKTAISITDVKFYMEYVDEVMGQMKISGSFDIGGISLQLRGEYSHSGEWEFSASGLTDADINFIGLWKSLEQKITGIGVISQIVPEHFLAFRIGTLYTSYSTRSGIFQLYVVLEQIKITDSFVIDNVLAEVKISRERFENLKIIASFRIAEIALLLDVIKESEGFSIQGGTQNDQKLPVGKLLSEFAGSILGYQVVLPEALQSFLITQIQFSYKQGKSQSIFSFDCVAAFGGSDSVLAEMFSAQAQIHIKAAKKEEQWKYGFMITCHMEVAGGQIIQCSYDYDKTDTQKENIISLSYQAKEKTDAITLGDILTAIGIRAIEQNWSFLTQIGISEASLWYDFENSRFEGKLVITSGGSFWVSMVLGEQFAYEIIVSSQMEISLSDLPVAGGIMQKLLPAPNIFTIKDMEFYAMSQPDEKRKMPAGVCFKFTVLDERKTWQIYERKQDSYVLLNSDENTQKIMWLKLNKTIAVFTIHRIGLGLDGTYLMAVLDASLNVAPLTFQLYGAGVGVDISDFSLRFYLTGFGVAFKNSTLTISGELKREEGSYVGTLLIQVRDIAVFAAVEYTEDGSLFAYAVVSGRIGGAPAFFITGLALGFAYNKRIEMPRIDQIQDFPLVKGAMGKIAREYLLEELKSVITEEKGQKFLAAGVKFTSFEIVESFVLLTVSFGNSFEINLLGLSDITMPPKCSSEVTPIAHAQLALKASLKPEEGFLGVEARLTSESYILSKDCHLTGGFAFYTWFAGEHSGDFVITLGGYHPKYEAQKPAHYPDVPRLGFNWNMGCLNLSGEIYFALTPCAVMAGGRLSAVYTLGPIRAYFIAKADFYLSWEPFAYDAEVGIVLGVQLRIKILFVSVTLKLELGANLHIWGPDFSGIARISLWIISFNIKFGAETAQGAKPIEWNEFCQTFLPKNKEKAAKTANADNAEEILPVKISFSEGLNGQIKTREKEYHSVGSNGVVLLVESVMPIHTAKVNEEKVELSAVSVCVKPMGEKGSRFKADMSVTIIDSCGEKAAFTGKAVCKNLPTAMWGGEGELVYNVPCGVILESKKPEVYLFPQKNEISLTELYMKGTTVIENAFQYMNPGALPSYTDVGTIQVFADTVNAENTAEQRLKYLHSLGIEPEEKISLKKYAEEAESYLDEEVLIAI